MTAATITASPPTAPIAISLGRRYVGERRAAGCHVIVIDGDRARPLMALSRDPLMSFTWGRFGPRARDLAWAILHDASDDAALASDWCSEYAAAIVAHLPYDRFSLRARDVLRWLDADRNGGWAEGPGTAADD